MNHYVMLGHNHLFGDFVEIIHANGGILKKVVQNLPEPIHERRLSLQQRLARLAEPESNPQAVNRRFPIEVEQLDSFIPCEDDLHFIGFTGSGVEGFRQQLLRRHSITLPPLIHPTAVIAASASILPGAVIHAGAIIASGVSIGEHASINKGAIIGHDTSIGAFSVIQPGVRIAGHVVIGKAAYIGIGAVIIEDLFVGEHAKIAAGAVVIDDVRQATLVAGVPAVFKKDLEAPADISAL
jgi:sugar O-acyltransferase (sialic acid O-acetyltransferase NeuD family)